MHIIQKEQGLLQLVTECELLYVTLYATCGKVLSHVPAVDAAGQVGRWIVGTPRCSQGANYEGTSYRFSVTYNNLMLFNLTPRDSLQNHHHEERFLKVPQEEKNKNRATPLEMMILQPERQTGRQSFGFFGKASLPHLSIRPTHQSSV